MTDTSPINQQQAPAKTKEKKQAFNMFSASYSQVFFKNFLAGLGRAFGGMVIYLVIFSGVFYFASQTLLPKLQILLNNFTPSVFNQNQSQTPTSINQIQRVLPQPSQ